MTTSLLPVSAAQKPVLRQLLELYLYDFSEYNDRDVSEFGFYDYPYLDTYWTEKDRFPFFIRADGKLAGFALVNGVCRLRKEPGARAMAEFFVLKKYRRKGVGTAAARQVFDRLPGLWEVDQHGKNLISMAFWEKVVSADTGGGYESASYLDDGVTYRGLLFDNSGRAHAPAIRLAEVTGENYWAVCGLEVNEDQHWFVAPNAYSLAEAKYEPFCQPYAVYDGETLAGFGMTGVDPKDGRCWILRFMIDRRYQRMGLGRAAFSQLLALAEKAADGGPVHLSAAPENEAARRLYRSFGFTDTHERCWNEIVMVKEAKAEKKGGAQ